MFVCDQILIVEILFTSSGPINLKFSIHISDDSIINCDILVFQPRSSAQEGTPQRLMV